MKKIMEFAERNSEIKKYLPEYHYDKNPNREWYWNFGKVQAYINNEFYSEHFIRREVWRVHNRAWERKRKAYCHAETTES